jgi:flagellar biosynthesis GTPase FlhF
LENSVLISFSKEEKKHIAESLYSMPISYAHSVAEIVSLCRKAVEQGKSVLIDYQSYGVEENEIKKLIDGLRRSFDKVEVLITLSSLHSELYNTKVVNTYRKFADGLILTFLDLCMNFGALFNIATKSEGLPFKFFSTGDIIPDDLEGATKERILAGIFQLD